MDSVNSMDNFSLLEEKVNALIECLSAEKERNEKLVTEKQELLARLEAVETSLLKGSQSIEELNQERALTKMVVEELINNIEKSITAKPKDSIEQEKISE